MGFVCDAEVLLLACSYEEVVEKYKVKYIAGGATQNAARVAQVCALPCLFCYSTQTASPNPSK